MGRNGGDAAADGKRRFRTALLYLGMADLATFSVSGSFKEAGVRVGDQTFRAWPVPGGKGGLFSLFAFAWNMPAGTIPLVYAANGAGNDVSSPIVVQFPKKEQPRYTVHDMQVSDGFVQKVVGELDPNGSGDPVARFVKINNEMRRANNKTLSELRFKPLTNSCGRSPLRGRLIRRLRPHLPTCETICIRARRSTSRCILDTTWQLLSMSEWKRQMTAVLCMRLRWAFMAIALSSTTVTDYRRSMAT